MDVIKTGLKNTFKILAVIAPVYWFVVDPIVNDWEDTVIYNAFFKPAPVVDESKEIASASYPQTIFTIGSIPKNAPEKIFIEDNSDFGDFDESNDEDPLDYY